MKTCFSKKLLRNLRNVKCVINKCIKRYAKNGILNIETNEER
jgi:hypothetical protein